MKALFLDRDGVINKDLNYVYKIEDFKFTYGIFKLLHKAKKLGYIIIIITNQAGIGRGLYTENQFNILMKWVMNEFLKRNIVITKFYFCPHHPIHGIGKYKKNCSCRKPKTLLFNNAKNEFNIDMSQSIMIGDKKSDIQAAKNSGVQKLILIDKNKNYKNSKNYRKYSSVLDIFRNYSNM